MNKIKCSHCSRPAVINIRYAGRAYCKKHFFRMTWKRFKSTVRNNELLQENQKVGVAMSGGKDSTVLIHLIQKLKEPLNLTIKAITIDEGVKEHRTPVLQITEQVCQDLGVKQEIVSFREEFGKTMDEIAKQCKEVNPCSYCGVLRRYLINKKARELDLDVLATGHNLDDEAQAILMNLMRGNARNLLRTGPKVGIKKFDKFVPRIKPLRDIPEREIAVYALLKGYPLSFSHDCPYVIQSFRDSVRVHLNQLEEEFPGTKISVVRTLDKFQDAEPSDFPEPKLCSDCGELTSSEICKACKLVKKL